MTATTSFLSRHHVYYPLCPFQTTSLSSSSPSSSLYTLTTLSLHSPLLTSFIHPFISLPQIHPCLERLLSAKRLRTVKSMGGLTINKWSTVSSITEHRMRRYEMGYVEINRMCWDEMRWDEIVWYPLISVSELFHYIKINASLAPALSDEAPIITSTVLFLNSASLAFALIKFLLVSRLTWLSLHRAQFKLNFSFSISRRTTETRTRGCSNQSTTSKRYVNFQYASNIVMTDYLSSRIYWSNCLVA